MIIVNSGIDQVDNRLIIIFDLKSAYIIIIKHRFIDFFYIREFYVLRFEISIAQKFRFNIP